MLRYYVQMGDMERSIIADCQRTGKPLPQKVLDAPSLTSGLEFFYNAFLDLITCRNMNGVIPWDVVDRYCERKGIEAEQAEELWSHVMMLDTVHKEATKKEGD